MKPENATDEAPNAPTTAVERTAWVPSVFIQHSSRLRGYITALTPGLGFVDDVFHETFLTVSTKAESYGVERDFLPWACGIARFKAMEAGRRAGRAWIPLSPNVIEAWSASDSRFLRNHRQKSTFVRDSSKPESPAGPTCPSPCDPGRRSGWGRTPSNRYPSIRKPSPTSRKSCAICPPSGPARRLCQELPAKSGFLTIKANS